MAKPQLYKGMPKWQVWAAFGGAVLIHATAVAIASLHPEPAEADLAGIPEAVVIATFEPAPPEPEPTPELEEPEPLPTPPPPTTEPEFKEEQPTPPPVKKERSKKPPAPIARPKASGPVGPQNLSGKAAMTYKPTIAYPYQARKNKITGSGVIVVEIDTSSGRVTSAEMGSSTGSPILDNAAVSAFRRARFQPNTVSKAKIPITFTLTGAQF